MKRSKPRTWGLARRVRVGRSLAKGAAGEENRRREVDLQASLASRSGGLVFKAAARG